MDPLSFTVAYATGASAALAPYAAALWVGRLERHRPPLAAMALGQQGAVTAALIDGSEPQQALAKEVRALGLPGDVLLAISAGRTSTALIAAVKSALAKDMSVVALTGADNGMAELLGETDVHVAVPHERAARIVECHALVLHCMADALDLQLMGEQDSA